MAWLAVDEGGFENIFDSKPERGEHVFDPEGWLYCIGLPKGSIKKLIGRDMTWEDEPVNLDNYENKSMF